MKIANLRAEIIIYFKYFQFREKIQFGFMLFKILRLQIANYFYDHFPEGILTGLNSNQHVVWRHKMADKLKNVIENFFSTRLSRSEWVWPFIKLPPLPVLEWAEILWVGKLSFDQLLFSILIFFCFQFYFFLPFFYFFFLFSAQFQFGRKVCSYEVPFS